MKSMMTMTMMAHGDLMNTQMRKRILKMNLTDHTVRVPPQPTIMMGMTPILMMTLRHGPIYTSSLLLIASYFATVFAKIKTFLFFVVVSYWQINDSLSSESKTPKASKEPQAPKKLLSGTRRSSLPRHDSSKKDENIHVKGSDNAEVKDVAEVLKTEDKNSSTSDVTSESVSEKPSTLTSAPGGSKRLWGRTAVSFFFFLICDFS